ncbi:hypothetical protein ACIGCM_03620 [Pseudomonas sp. NPDC078700]|uniref:hypothetical protein n=1 Tax=Pseudomonas sp. NPDC078700 TaxID=3364424 RepID=UPI0037C56DAB
MDDLGKSAIVKVAGKEVVCRELDVAGVRRLLETERQADLVLDALFEEIRLGDLPVMTSLTKEEIEHLLPSQLEAVIDGCKKANPNFFGLLARLNKVVKAVA